MEPDFGPLGYRGENIRLAPEASPSARRAVEILEHALQDGRLITPAASAAGQCWLSLNYFTPLSPAQLETILAKDGEWLKAAHRLAGSVRTFLAADLPLNHFEPSGYRVAGPPEGAQELVELLRRALPVLERLEPHRPDIQFLLPDFEDFLLMLKLGGMAYEGSGGIVDLILSAPTDWEPWPPIREQDLGGYLADRGGDGPGAARARLNDYLRVRVSAARRRNGLRIRARSFSPPSSRRRRRRA